jgi:hypothetical protein
MAWFEYQDTLEIQNAPSLYGPVSYTLMAKQGMALLTLDTSAVPSKGFALVPPFPIYMPQVEIDGRKIIADMDIERRGEIPVPSGAISIRVD